MSDEAEFYWAYHDERAVWIDYTNYRGTRRVRHVIPDPNGFYWRNTPEHTEPQWLLNAWDIEKNALRSFALSGIHGWFMTKPEKAP